MPPPIPIPGLGPLQQVLDTYAAINQQVERYNELLRQQQQFFGGGGGGGPSPESISAFERFIELVKSAGNGIKNLGKGIIDLGAGIVKRIVFPAEFLNGFRSGLTLTNALFGRIMGLGKTAFGLLKNIGMTLLSFPGKIMEFFQGAAGGGTDPLREALEEVRDAYGNLQVGTSAAIIGMTKDMKGFSEAGVGFGRVFGYGRQGLANLMKENLELAKGMGGVFNQMISTVNTTSPLLTILRKSTFLGAEAFKTLTLNAQGAGRSVQSEMSSLSIKLVQASRTFGISTKELSKEINDLMKDTSTFGRMTQDVMIKTSVYVKKLGISVETLKKVIDKSLNFEDAANMAANLAETFNMNIDAMKLMKEQDATKKLDMIRESFFRTGRSVESLNLQEMKALQNATNLTDEELRLAFAQKNRNVTQAQLAEQAKKGQKQQISEAEAMQELSKSIKQLVQSGSGMKGSFFQVFMDGFETGIKRSRDFRRVVHNLQRSMREVFRAGIEVGRMFVNIFPGIKEILGGLGDMFDPARYRRMMSEVKAAFRDFFNSLTNDPEGGFKTFMDRMKKMFLDSFQTGSATGSRFINGLKTFYKTVGIIFVQGLKYALNMLVEFIKSIGQTIENPSGLANSSRGLGGRILDIFKDAIIYTVKQLGPVALEVLKAITGVIKSLTKKLREILDSEKAGGPGIRGFFRNLFGLDGAQTEGRKTFEILKKTVLPVIKDLFLAIVDLGKVLLPFAMQAILLYLKPALIFGVLRGLFSQALTLLSNNIPWGTIFRGLLNFAGTSTFIAAAVLVLVGMLAREFSKNSKKAAEFMDKIAEHAKNLGKIIGQVIGTIIKYVIDILKVAWRYIVKFFTDSEWRNEILGSLLAALMSIGNVVLQFVGGIITGALEALGLKDLAKEFQDVFKEISDGVKDFTTNWRANFKLIRDFLSDWYDNNIKPIIDALVAAFQIASNLIGQAFTALGEFLAFPFRLIGDFFNLLSKGINILPDWLKPEWLKKLGKAYGSIGSIFTNTGDLIKGLFGGIGNIFTGMSKGFNEAINAIKAEFTKAWEWITNLNPSGWYDNYIKPIFDSITTGVGAAIDIFKGLFNLIASPITMIIDLVSESITQVISFFKGIYDNFIQLKTAVGNVFNYVSNGFSNAKETIIRDLRGIGEWFSRNNPFALIGRAMTGVENLARRIHGNSINTIVANDLNRIEDPARRMQNNISNSIETGFRNAANSSRTHTQTIAQNVERANQQVQLSSQITAANVATGASTTAPTAEAVTSPSISTEQINGIRNVVAGVRDLPESREFSQSLFNMHRVIKAMDDQFKGDEGIGAKITSLTNTIKAIVIPEGISDKIKKIGEVFDVIKNLTGVVATLRIPSGENQTRQLNILTEVFEPVMNLLEYLFTDPVKSLKLKNIINSIAGAEFKNIGAASERITSISRVFEILKTVTESVKTLADLGGNNSRIRSNFLDIPMDNISTAINTINQDMISGKTNPLKNPELFKQLDPILKNIGNRAPQLTSIKDKIVEMINAINGMAGVTATETAASKIAENLRILVGSLNSLEEGLQPGERGNIGQRIIDIKEAMKGRISREVRGMVQAYNRLSTELIADIPRLDMTLRTAGETLTADRSLRIERGAFNLDIKVNIIIDAGDVTNALYTFNRNNNNFTKKGNFSNTAFNTKG